jgi:small-conductance mechanosensitive channel
LTATTGTAQAAVPALGAAGGAESADTQAVQLPEQLTREQIRDLLSKLSDDQARALLIRELDKQAVDSSEAAADEDVDAVDQIHDVVETARLQLAEILNSGPGLSRLPEQIWSQVTLAGTVSSWPIVLGLVLMFAAGWIAETLVRRATGIGGMSAPESAPQGLMARLGASMVRGLMSLFALLVFGVVAFIVMSAAVWNNAGAEPLFGMAFSVVVILRSIAIVMDVVLAPGAPGIRLVSLDDGAVRALRWRLLVLVGFLVVNTVVIRSLDVFGVEPHVAALLRLIVATMFVIALIIMIWEARHPYAVIIRGGDAERAPGESGFVDSLAAHWHLVATAAVLILFALGMGKLGVEEPKTEYSGIKTLTLLMLLPLIDLGLRRFVARFFKPKDEDEMGAAGAEKSMLTLAPASAATPESGRAASREIQAVVLKNLRIVLGFIAIVLALGFWGVEAGGVAKAIAGERIGKAFFDIVVTALLAYAVWSVVKAVVSFHMKPAEGSEGDGAAAVTGDIGGAGQTRMETLLPLFRKVVLITLLIMAVLLVLSSLGVNIGPLIAGAGVLGLAIGFGAQALVRDIVSGIFFLLDDAFRMGEYVEIGDIRGSVEGISIRSLRLRHHNGPLHTVPFGEIKNLTNYSRDWAIMKFELRLPFETDINKVRKIIKTVGQEMEQDEELAPLMLATLKSQGVNRMEDSALIIRCKFTALPGQQFYVRREAFTRIQKAFEENGIRFAPKRVIVEAATPELAVAGAAALEASEPEAGAAKRDDRG